MTFPQHDDLPESPISKLFRAGARWLHERRKRTAAACLRCGRRGSVNCQACDALVCERCWVLSIETGSAFPLCVDCVATPRQIGYGRIGTDTANLFRSGAQLLLAGIGAFVLYGYSRAGFPGAWGVVAVLLQPAVTLGLVPMAFLLGAVQRGAVILVRSLFRDSDSSR